MKTIVLFISLLGSTLAVAHTPVCRCELSGQHIQCQGGYHDGSDAVDVTMTVQAYSGETLSSGKLDKASRFRFSLPRQPFYVLMDVGPGEMFEVDWRDIKGMDGDYFAAADNRGASEANSIHEYSKTEAGIDETPYE